MKIVYALTKNLGFMIRLDPEAQSSVQTPQALLQTLINVLHYLPIQGEQFQLGENSSGGPLVRSAHTWSCRFSPNRTDDVRQQMLAFQPEQKSLMHA